MEIIPKVGSLFVAVRKLLYVFAGHICIGHRAEIFFDCVFCALGIILDKISGESTQSNIMDARCPKGQWAIAFSTNSRSFPVICKSLSVLLAVCGWPGEEHLPVSWLSLSGS